MRIPIIDLPATCDNLKRVFDERGYTIAKIQKEIGLESAQAVYKWFSGKSLPSIDNLIIISDRLGIPLDDIIIKKYIDI